MTRRRITIEASEEDVNALAELCHWHGINPDDHLRHESKRAATLASRIEAALREEER